MRPTTAVIFAAGFGSRMLPVTAAVQKELLPILERPIIDYVVGDCVTAGITRIIFIIRPGSHGLQDYYVGNAELEAHLRRYHKTAELEKLAAVHQQATFEFVEQPTGAGYGTAVPVMVAAPHLPEGEPFLVCGGDDFLWHPDGASETAGLINTFAAAEDAVGALMALERPREELHRYGVLKVRRQDNTEYLEELVEKPAAENAPSNLINISKYILTPQLLEYVLRTRPDAKSGELYITDAIHEAARRHRIAVHRAAGRFLDAGSVATWLEANQVVGRALDYLQSG